MRVPTIMGVKEFEDYILKADFFYVWVSCYTKKKRGLNGGVWVSSSREQMNSIASMRSSGEKVQGSYDRDTNSLWV